MRQNRIVDSHRHFWEITRFNYDWMSPADTVLFRDQLPLAADVSIASGVAQTIAVQAHQSAGETRWLLELADRFDFIAGVVGWVDLQSRELENQLAEFAGHPKFKGVRHIIQDEPEDDWVLKPEVLRGIRMLSKFDLTYDILIFPKHLKYIPRLIESCPEVRFVVDHLAKPPIASGEISKWKAGVQTVAQFPQVYAKLSGLVTEADHQNWQTDDLRPYADAAIELFGAERLMFGSDYPVCLLAADYAQVLTTYQSLLKSLSKAEQHQIMGENAVRFYNLEN